jgi:hypothetical protein
MPRPSLPIRSVAETGLHERLTLVGFILSYFALVGVILSSTVPFLANNWSVVWLPTLFIGSLAALLIVVGLFVWPNGYQRWFQR